MPQSSSSNRDFQRRSGLNCGRVDFTTILTTFAWLCFGLPRGENSVAFTKAAERIAMRMCRNLGVARPHVPGPWPISELPYRRADPQGTVSATRRNIRVEVDILSLSAAICERFEPRVIISFSRVQHGSGMTLHLNGHVAFKEAKE